MPRGWNFNQCLLVLSPLQIGFKPVLGMLGKCDPELTRGSGAQLWQVGAASMQRQTAAALKTLQSSTLILSFKVVTKLCQLMLQLWSFFSNLFTGPVLFCDCPSGHLSRILSGSVRKGVQTGGEAIIPDGWRSEFHSEPQANSLQKNKKNVKISECRWVVKSMTFKTKKTKQKTDEQRAPSDPYHNAFQLHCGRHSDSKKRKRRRGFTKSHHGIRK